jgi:hypothetical protein
LLTDRIDSLHLSSRRRIIEVSSLVDQITRSLDLQTTDRYALMMARATALAGNPKLAIAKVKAGLRRITER